MTKEEAVKRALRLNGYQWEDVLRSLQKDALTREEFPATGPGMLRDVTRHGLGRWLDGLDAAALGNVLSRLAVEIPAAEACTETLGLY